MSPPIHLQNERSSIEMNDFSRSIPPTPQLDINLVDIIIPTVSLKSQTTPWTPNPSTRERPWLPHLCSQDESGDESRDDEQVQQLEVDLAGAGGGDRGHG